VTAGLVFHGQVE